MSVYDVVNSADPYFVSHKDVDALPSILTQEDLCWCLENRVDPKMYESLLRSSREAMQAEVSRECVLHRVFETVEIKDPASGPIDPEPRVGFFGYAEWGFALTEPFLLKEGGEAT